MRIPVKIYERLDAYWYRDLIQRGLVPADPNEDIERVKRVQKNIKFIEGEVYLVTVQGGTV